MHNISWDILEDLDILSDNLNSNTILVQDINTKKKYVKKYIPRLVLNVYKRLQKIDNIHIPKILLIDELADNDNDNYSMIIEEYIEGKNIDTLLKEKNIFSQGEVLEYSIQICDGLQQIHNNNIVHRDIKPSNIILGNDGIIRLIDYGIARIIKDKSQKDTLLFATPGYAPPEQFGSDQTDVTADIHNLGVTINEMLTGKHINEELCKSQFKHVVIKCIDKDPKRRYLSALKLREDLLRIKNKTSFFYFNKGKISELIIIAILITGFIVYNVFIKPTLASEPVAPTLNYVVNQSEKNNKGEFYSNGEGDLLFGRMPDVMLFDSGKDVGFSDVYYVNNTIPESYILFTFENTGTQNMENISLTFEFSGLMLWNDINCWNQQGDGFELVFSDHVKGLAGYGTMRFDLGLNLRPGEISELITIDMSECPIFDDVTASVTITVTADDCPSRIFTIPVGFSD